MEVDPSRAEVDGGGPSAGEAREALGEGAPRCLVVLHSDAKTRGARSVVAPQNGDARRAEVILQSACRGVRCVHPQEAQALAPHQPRGRERRRDGLGVRAHQAAGTEKDPAEVPHDYGRGVAQVGNAVDRRAFEERLEHRHAGCPRGLSVVAAALDHPVRAQHKGAAVVPGIVKLSPQVGDEGAGLLLRLRAAQDGDEPRSLDLELVPMLAVDGAVAEGMA